MAFARRERLFFGRYNMIERMKDISRRLQEAAKAYYQENREILTNLEYDRLYEELETLEAKTGIQLADSPTNRVGYEAVEGLEKVAHEVPLLSLDKTKDVDKLAEFLDGHIGLLSWKLDGLTVVLRYENGALQQAVTRGNGIIGEDVTHNARTFANIPIRIPYTGRFIVRGEAVITYKDFEAINVDNLYKNPRNLCSGTVRQLDSGTAADRRVRYYAFAILLEEEGQRSAQLSHLADLGFEVVEHRLVTASSIENDVNDFLQKLPQLGIPSDGLVAAYDDIAYSLSLGTTSKFPRDALAFKWEDELKETTLQYIEWNTSRTGLINPIAVFEPVEIEGTIVNKAGLHNVSIIRQLALGEGDRITVYKANMIIPQVAENLTKSDTALPPEHCPACDSPTEILKQKEGEALYCPNPNCMAQIIGALTHFCSRDAMNIEGLSEQTLEKWVEKGFISDYTNIFGLKVHEEEIIQMEGFGQKSFDNLMAAIERAKDINLANFIFALGIKHVGLSNAKLLAGYFGNMEAIIEKSLDRDAFLGELAAIKGFGEAITGSLCDYFYNDNNLVLLKKAMEILRIIPVETKASELHGLIFVITGNVEHFPNRKALQAHIEERGGKCTGSVSANTSYLINNDITSTSSKNKKAQSLGIPILTEKMFLEKF